MATRRSITKYAKQAKARDNKVRAEVTTARESASKAGKGTSPLTIPTVDSFINFAQNVGIGADNPLTTAGYGFNPITRNRTGVEWIHRGSWIGGVAVDIIADDMTRAGVNILGELKPDQLEKIEQAVHRSGSWGRIRDMIAWSRLYGGAISVFLIDGQKLDTPLRIETIGKDAFRGMLTLDRWMVDPSLNDLVTELGPNLGLPKFYTVTSDAPALPLQKIHHTRVIRHVAVPLPHNQRVQEDLWGTSVLERLYDRLVAFDSATTGAAQLVYKAFIRTYKIKGMREIAAAGGPAMRGLTKYVDMMRRYQNNEGITLMDADDEYEGHQQNSFGGLGDILKDFGQQLSGALGIPLVRLFGQSPAGFSTGDTDVRNYYDTIKKNQNHDLGNGVEILYRCVASSLGIKLPNNFGIEFKSLWQLMEREKAEISNMVVDAATKAQEAGLISDQIAMKELRQSSRTTGIFTNITAEDIEQANDEIEPPPMAEELGLMASNGLQEGKAIKAEEEEEPDSTGKPGKTEKADKAETPGKPDESGKTARPRIKERSK